MLKIEVAHSRRNMFCSVMYIFPIFNMYLGWSETQLRFMRHFASNHQNVAASLRPAFLLNQYSNNDSIYDSLPSVSAFFIGNTKNPLS